jgi:hypothetical protein
MLATSSTGRPLIDWAITSGGFVVVVVCGKVEVDDDVVEVSATVVVVVVSGGAVGRVVVEGVDVAVQAVAARSTTTVTVTARRFAGRRVMPRMVVTGLRSYADPTDRSAPYFHDSVASSGKKATQSFVGGRMRSEPSVVVR